jgi:hypothetical protein
MNVILEGGPRDGETISVPPHARDFLVPIPEKIVWSVEREPDLYAWPAFKTGRYSYKGSARHYVMIWEYDAP